MANAEASSSRSTLVGLADATSLPSQRSGTDVPPKGKGRAASIPADEDVTMGEADHVTRDDSDTDGSEDEDINEEDYELERERRILENAALLNSLGIAPLASASSSASLFPSSGAARSSPTRKRKKPPGPSAPVYDRSGHILSLPREGETHKMACVEIPSDRRIKKRISDGEYTDCMHWTEGEARRWRFGFGKGKLEKDEPKYVGNVGPEFRWRRWKGLKKELMRELRQMGQMNEVDHRGGQEETVEKKPPAGVSAYSLLTGAPCHQCRRKSDKAKMKCRNLNPTCHASFCETCCKRYSYFAFDPESRTFICPLCKDCCNCANCIRKRNLSHLLDGKRGLQIKVLQKSLLPAAAAEGNQSRANPATMTIQDILVQAVVEKVNVPFDCVRLVNEAEDVITPELPSEIVPPPKPPKKPRKAGRPKKEKVVKEKKEKEPGTTKEKKGGKKAKPAPTNQGLAPLPSGDYPSNSGNEIPIDPELLGVGEQPKAKPKPVMLKFKIPKPAPAARAEPPRPKVKEVDSDGDTVGDYSSEGGGSDSSLSSLSSGGGGEEEDQVKFSPRVEYTPNVNAGHFEGMPFAPNAMGGSGGEVTGFPGMEEYAGYNGFSSRYGTSGEYDPLGGTDMTHTNGRAVHPASSLHMDQSLEPWQSPSPPKKFKPRPKNATILREPRYSQTPTPPRRHSPLPDVSGIADPPAALRNHAASLGPDQPDINHTVPVPSPQRPSLSHMDSNDAPSWLSNHASSISNIHPSPSSLNGLDSTYPSFSPSMPLPQDLFDPSFPSAPSWYAAQFRNPPPYSHSPPSIPAKLPSMSSLPTLPSMTAMPSHHARQMFSYQSLAPSAAPLAQVYGSATHLMASSAPTRGPYWPRPPTPPTGSNRQNLRFSGSPQSTNGGGGAGEGGDQAVRRRSSGSSLGGGSPLMGNGVMKNVQLGLGAVSQRTVEDTSAASGRTGVPQTLASIISKSV